MENITIMELITEEEATALLQLQERVSKKQDVPFELVYEAARAENKIRDFLRRIKN